MTVRKLDASGDIATSGEQFISGQKEIAQTIKTRLALYKGEYFRDVYDGTDWFGKIIGKRQLGIAEAEIRRRIIETPNVLAIASFNSDFDLATRRLFVDASVITPNGDVQINFESGL
tara:strand:+ start:299 stop:649 length:351 start_codon:yes stop_codon:yes gene_type:complete